HDGDDQVGAGASVGPSTTSSHTGTAERGGNEFQRCRSAGRSVGRQDGRRKLISPTLPVPPGGGGGPAGPRVGLASGPPGSSVAGPVPVPPPRWRSRPAHGPGRTSERKDCHSSFGSVTAARTLPDLAEGAVPGRHLTSNRAATATSVVTGDHH